MTRALGPLPIFFVNVKETRGSYRSQCVENWIWRGLGPVVRQSVENNRSLFNLFALKLQKICVCVKKVMCND
jgi:hypothetical protein